MALSLPSVNSKSMSDNWLALGLKLREMRKAGDEAGWQEEIAQGKHSAQTLYRLMRAAAFMNDHFHEEVAAGQIKAGSAAVLELIQLYEFDSDLAKAEAPGVFSGEKSVRDIRHLRRQVQEKKVPASSRLAHHSQRYTSFSELAVSLLMKKSELLGNGEKVVLTQSPVRDTLSPKLYGTTRDGRTIAVDIKAPDPTAARTKAAAAASLASRIGVLLLRFSKVVIVLPDKAEVYAEATLDLLSSWAVEPKLVLSSVSFLILDTNTHQTRVHSREWQPKG